MSHETLMLFDLPDHNEVPKLTQEVKGVAVDVAVAAFALDAIAKLSGDSNRAEGLAAAAQDPELRATIGIPEPCIDAVVEIKSNDIVEPVREDDTIDPRVMRHLSSLTRPAALETAGFDPDEVRQMIKDTAIAVDGYIGTKVHSDQRKKNLRKVFRLAKSKK
jgi:hypothetical protein